VVCTTFCNKIGPIATFSRRCARHRRKKSFTHIREGNQSPDWVFGEPEEASFDEGPVISLLQGSQLSYDADSVPTNCHQGYKTRVPEDGHHSHMLLLFKDLTEDILQGRAERPT
jgi:hypothetical protein